MSSKKKYADPRTLIIDIVQSVLNGQDLQATLHKVLDRAELPSRDKHLATQICYNYFRLKNRLEYIISRMLTKKRSNLPIRLEVVLGLAVYELLYLDRVPEYATVHWYVDYVKKRLNPGLFKLSNAVLRKVARSGQELQKEEFYRQGAKSQEEFWSRYYSCPQWIVRILTEQYGPENCLALLQAFLKTPPVGLRINQTLSESEAVRQTFLTRPYLVRSLNYGLALKKTEEIDLKTLERNGLVSRQSLAVQEAIALMEPKSWSEPIWDMCAGRGGKTTLFLEEDLRSIWASDLLTSKLVDLKQELNRLSLPNIPIFTHDARLRPPIKKYPKTVVLDVPCTGFGVLSRRPDIKWKRKQNDIERLGLIQERMLNMACQYLHRQGRLVYITCTLTQKENQKQIRRILDNQPHSFDLEFEWQNDFQNQLFEYFYVAVLRKKAG